MLSGCIHVIIRFGDPSPNNPTPLHTSRLSDTPTTQLFYSLLSINSLTAVTTSQGLRLCPSFSYLTFSVHAAMSGSQGHKHTGSVTQNHKAQLANAYNELGKELSSTKIRVVGNYTLGKVIGEGGLDPLSSIISPHFEITYCRGVRKGANGYTPFDIHSCRHQANS